MNSEVPPVIKRDMKNSTLYLSAILSVLLLPISSEAQVSGTSEAAGLIRAAKEQKKILQAQPKGSTLVDFCKTGAETFLLRMADGYHLYVCDKDLSVPRGVSRGELFLMFSYSVDESNPDKAANRGLWAAYMETSEPQIDAKLLQLNPKEMLDNVDKRLDLMTKMAQWYSRSPQKPEVVANNAKFKKAAEAYFMGACINGDMKISMRDTGETSCLCGNEKVENFVDFECVKNVYKMKTGVRQTP